MKGAQKIFTIIVAAIISMLILIVGFNIIKQANSNKLTEKDAETLDDICLKFGVDVKTGEIKSIDKISSKDAIAFTDITSKLCDSYIDFRKEVLKCKEDPSLDVCIVQNNKLYLSAADENIVKAIKICSAYARASTLCIDTCGFNSRFLCLKNIDQAKSWCNGDFLESIGKDCCGSSSCSATYEEVEE